jgi:hypothetical protein
LGPIEIVEVVHPASQEDDAFREEDAMTTRKSLRLVVILFLVSIAALPLTGTIAQNTGTSVSVQLKEYEDSGISGTAVLTSTPTGGVHVSMELTGQELDGNHPTHIHTGTCANFDPSPIYPLETVNLSSVNREGLSESDVTNTTLGDLRNGEFVILVHQSPEELTNYLVCGDISAAKAMPVTGTGALVSDGWSGIAPLIALGTLALLSAAGGEMLRKRQQ